MLAASALSTLTFGCSKQPTEPKRDPDTTQPLPGNPKGTFYDDAMVAPVVPDASLAAADAEIRPLPGNPKGTLYDAGVGVKPSPPDASLRPLPRDAAVVPPPRDAAIRRTPPDGPPLKSNPKGSLYDKGHDKNDQGL